MPGLGMAGLKLDPGGWRRYVDDQPVHCGDRLEVQLEIAGWLTVRYEASWPGRWSSPDVTEFLVFGRVNGRELRLVIDPKNPPPLRWPQ